MELVQIYFGGDFMLNLEGSRWVIRLGKTLVIRAYNKGMEYMKKWQNFGEYVVGCGDWMVKRDTKDNVNWGWIKWCGIQIILVCALKFQGIHW